MYIIIIIYTSPLSKLISSYPKIYHHLYADDTEVYIKLTPDNASSVKPELSFSPAFQQLKSGWQTVNGSSILITQSSLFFGLKKTNVTVFLNFSLFISWVTKYPQRIKFCNLGVIFWFWFRLFWSGQFYT